MYFYNDPTSVSLYESSPYIAEVERRKVRFEILHKNFDVLNNHEILSFSLPD